MSDEAVTTTTEAAPEAAALEAEATETETTEAAPETPAEPPAPRQRALARKAERDAINAKKRLAAAEAKEAELSAKLERLAQLEAYTESLRSADPLERARLADIDIAALSKATLEADTPEARQRAIVEEELAKRERQAEEHRSAQMRAHQAQQESEFTDEGKRHAVIGALLKADDDDGEPLLTERELLAQGYRMAARINAKLKADGQRRAASNQEILDAIGAKYSRRFAPTERAPEKPAVAKPVNGSATAARGASRPAPRTLQEMNARFRELMGAGDLPWQRSTSQQYRTTSRSCTRTCWKSSGTPIGRSSAWSRRRSNSRARTTRTRCRTRTGRDARRIS